MQILAFIAILLGSCHQNEARIIPGIQNNTFQMIFLVPWTKVWPLGGKVASALQVGLQTVRQKQYLPGYDVKFAWRDTMCTELRGVAMVLELWETLDDIDIVIGEIFFPHFN